MHDVLTFLNSELFQGVAILLAGFIWKKTKMTDTRREQIRHYGDEMFDVVEVIAQRSGITGVQKWTMFLDRLKEQLKDEKKSPLSDKEIGELKNIAIKKAWLKKSIDKSIPVTMKKE